jgi:dynein heavy chain 1, cytosolic
VWTQEFHRVVGLICSLPRLESDKYQGSLVKKEKGKENYENVLFKVAPEILEGAYRDIFTVFRSAEDYLRIWFNYEALWIIDAKKIYERLGDDINKWQALLNEIRENRRTFDNSQTERSFGPLIINYRLVLNKINTKYDSWHAEILGHFGEKFGETLKSFFNNMLTAKGKLEKINFQNLSADIVEMVNEFQGIKRKYNEWCKEVEKFDSSNKLLERQRYKYPADWMELDKVMIEWSNLRQIYNRKAGQLDSEMDRLKEKVLSDEKRLNEKINDIETQWNREKPSTNADVVPKEALTLLDTLNMKINNVRDNYSRCCEAKELLGLEPGNLQKLENLR